MEAEAANLNLLGRLHFDPDKKRASGSPEIRSLEWTALIARMEGWEAEMLRKEFRMVDKWERSDLRVPR